MYEAYSEKTKSIINITETSEYTDCEEHYKCPNPACDAEFYPKSFNSNVRPHFCRYKTTPHVVGCPYALENPNYHDTKISDKYSLEDILSNHAKSAGTAVSTQSNNSKSENRSSFNIHTPRQLLNYCVSNSLDTVYLNELTVNDIIVDSRNLNKSGLLFGFNGIRLLLGTIDELYFSKLKVQVTSKSKKGNTTHLHADIHVNNDMRKLIKNYCESNRQKTSHPQIAVFAEWKKTKDFYVETTLISNSQIIML